MTEQILLKLSHNTRVKSKLLLHACCAPCASHPAEDLKTCFDITLVFYGPNIHPEKEYRKRLNSTFKLADILMLNLVELEYNPDIWFSEVAGLEKESEGGRRCSKCHRIRLIRIAEYAKDNDYQFFATTLTTSPHKPSSVINPIGKEIARIYGVNFLEKDLKKQNGFKKSCDLSKKHGLYRQKYCGCVFSQKTEGRRQITDSR